MKKWYAVIGDPIAQSMSPGLHGAWFDDNAIDATYIPLHIQAEKLEQAVESLKSLGCNGWNVTVPHKNAIIPFLDRLDPSAEQMGAVNTVHVLPDGILVGSNTDGLGFVQSLEEAYGEQCKGRKVLLIGAGGAARGIAFALEHMGYGPIVITNRTVEKAQQLAANLEGASAQSLAEAEETLADYGLIVQTTSVGMNFAQEGMPLNPKNIAADAVVADIIYNPLETEFLEQARNNGAKTLNGVGMFVHQGALAFQKWTGIRPATEKTIEKITAIVGGK
ncbi:shikimate dehydrogenase [Sporosarcina soli]|uniref:Shikimate dehydrogenase (NADP(+)) n=1 Tax=Sporosarcina soli TaxID=334736 RepID=A0ABW0TNQ7_9BACL